MKRLSIVLLALTLILSLAACGESLEEQNKKITRGVINGNVYTSEYNGVTFTKPDSWKFSTDEEIAATMDLGADALDQNKFEETLTKAVSVYDMMANDPVYGSSVVVSYENLSLTSADTEKEYIDALKTQLKGQTATLYTIGDTSTKTISGESYSVLETSALVNAVSLNQIYCVRKIDNFMLGIVITAPSSVSADDIFAMFS